MPVPQGIGQVGEPETLLQLDQPTGLLLGPLQPPEGRPEVFGVVAKLVAVDGFVARRADVADLLDPAFECLLGDDLEDRHGQAIAIDHREQVLPHGNGIGGRIPPCPATSRGDDRPGDPHVEPPPMSRMIAAREDPTGTRPQSHGQVMPQLAGDHFTRCPSMPATPDHWRWPPLKLGYEHACPHAPRDRGRQVRVRRESGPDSSAGWTHRTRDKTASVPRKGAAPGYADSTPFSWVRGDAMAS